MRALREALSGVGVEASASNHIPPKTKTITIEQWRDYAYRMGISEGGERAQQKAFKEAFEFLNGSHIGVWGNLVWDATTKSG
jgi:hypothetical protein